MSPVTSNSASHVPTCTTPNNEDDPILTDHNSNGAPPFILVLTTCSALGGFLFGYDTGVISGAMILIREEFSLSSVWQELIVSVTIAAAALFALIGASLSDLLGRKPVILLASLVFTIGSVTMGSAQNRETLLVGRVIIGCGIGKLIQSLITKTENQGDLSQLYFNIK